MSSPFVPARVCAEFPARFKTTIRLLNWTQTGLAAKLGVHRSTIQDWTKGATPSQILFDQMCDVLGNEARRYLSGKTSKPPTPVV